MCLFCLRLIYCFAFVASLFAVWCLLVLICLFLYLWFIRCELRLLVFCLCFVWICVLFASLFCFVLFCACSCVLYVGLAGLCFVTVCGDLFGCFVMIVWWLRLICLRCWFCCFVVDGFNLFSLLLFVLVVYLRCGFWFGTVGICFNSCDFVFYCF